VYASDQMKEYWVITAMSSSRFIGSNNGFILA
jgi:hypothetical protein